MRLSARLAGPLLVAGALLALGGGAALGATLGERASRPGRDTLIITDPTLAAAGTDQALRSPAGFTGFDGAGGLAGAAVRVGAVTAPRDGAFEVTAEGASLGIRLTSTARLFRLRAAAEALRPGDAVVVRVQPDGSAAGVLRVPRDLNEGVGRPTPTRTPSATPTPNASATATSTSGTPGR